MNKNIAKTERRTKIRSRIRSTISGTAECPRLSVYKSNKFVYLQLIDDVAGVTLAASKAKCGLEGAKTAGSDLAKLAQDKGIKTVVNTQVILREKLSCSQARLQKLFGLPCIKQSSVLTCHCPTL